jgi:anti-sigma regulatory factor (Ser/Thr protein kinase)
MKIYFSTSDYLRNFDRFINALDLADPETLHLTAHPRWVNVHPAILAFTATLALTVGRDNVTFDNFTASSAHYLDRMGLFNFTKNQSPYHIAHNEPAGRFIPLTIIKNSADQSRFITDMIPLLHLPPEKTDAIKYVIGELVRNVLEHSYSESGAVVAAQYYKKSNTVRIGICDNGIGIWRSMQQSWHPKTELDALKLALSPGISGTTSREGGTMDNAGAGLYFIKSIAQVARNYFLVYSGKAIYELLLHDKRIKKPRLHPDPNDDRHSERNDAPDFRGTLVAVDLTLDGDTDDFEQLMVDIRESYTRAIRERKKIKYREPRWHR